MTETAAAPDLYRIRPRIAWQALQKLLRDPEDTAQVFVIVRALSGRSVVRGHRRFAATATGQAVLCEERDLLDTLEDRTYLARLPAGSLGRAYLEFMERQEITAGGLVDASAADETPTDPGLRRYAQRLRDMHDLWHVATGYGTDTIARGLFGGSRRGVGPQCGRL